MEKSCAIDLRVAGLSPAGQLLIYFHNVFPVLTKTLCQRSSLVPKSASKLLYANCGTAQPAFAPPPPPPPPRSDWPVLVYTLCPGYGQWQWPSGLGFLSPQVMASGRSHKSPFWFPVGFWP